MANLNQCIFTGRLITEPELKQTKSGKSVCTFNIACEDGYGDNKKVYYPTFIAWNGQAEFVSKLSKGTKIIVTSRYTERKWEKKNKDSAGRDATEKRTAYEFIVSSIEAGESKRASSTQQDDRSAEQPQQQYSYSQNQNANFEEINPNDDLPF